MSLIGTLAVRAISRYNAGRMRLRVEGVANVPTTGPAVIAARHYHHLLDGVAIVRSLRRTPYVFVALDWTRTHRERRVMETACGLAEWPIALRAENLDGGRTSAFAREEIGRYTRRALAQGAKLLARGDTLLVFPEGHPTIDPMRPRKASPDAYLPFRGGLLAMVATAQRTRDLPIPIVPTGLTYARDEPYDVTLRFGMPVSFVTGTSRATFLADLAARVRALSG